MRSNPVVDGKKKCTKCSQTLDVCNFSPNKRTNKLLAWCKFCTKDYKNGWRVLHAEKIRLRVNERRKDCREERNSKERIRLYELGLARPLSADRNSALYLGVYVTEGLLSNIFKNIKHMGINNPGYDFICDKGFLVDSKASCLRKQKRQKPLWQFTIKRNTVADYFACVGFDNRTSLKPVHFWLIPGRLINNHVSITISDTKKGLEQWSKYEKPIDRVIGCCEAMKAEASL